MSVAWQPRQKHEREVRDALLDAGYEVLEGWYAGSAHLRLRVRRAEKVAILTLACSPRRRDYAVVNVLKQARRAVAP